MINPTLARAARRIFAASAATLVFVSAGLAAEVNVYSYRQPQLVEPLFEKFTAETGIKVNTIFANKGLIERIEAEGRNSPADVLLTTDISRLDQADHMGITQPAASEILAKDIPAQFRDKDGRWMALTLRARVT